MKNKIAQLNKDASWQDLNFYAITLSRIRQHFDSEIERERIIPMHELRRYLCLLFSINRQQFRQLIRGLSGRYADVKIVNHGVRVSRNDN